MKLVHGRIVALWARRISIANQTRNDRSASCLHELRKHGCHGSQRRTQADMCAARVTARSTQAAFVRDLKMLASRDIRQERYKGRLGTETRPHRLAYDTKPPRRRFRSFYRSGQVNRRPRDLPAK